MIIAWSYCPINSDSTRESSTASPTFKWPAECTNILSTENHNSYSPHSTDHHWISVVAVGCLVQAACPQEYFYTSIVSSPLTWWYPLLRTLCDWLPETSPHPAASSLSRWNKENFKNHSQSKSFITQIHLQIWEHSSSPIPLSYDHNSERQRRKYFFSAWSS